MAKTTIDMVREFQRAFGDEPHDKPGWPKDTTPQARRLIKELGEDCRELARRAHDEAKRNKGNTMLLRAQLMLEEVGELLEAMSLNDIAAVLHEGADVRYVVDGTLIAFGLGKVYEKAVGEIHRANMSKLEDGKPVKDAAGRVLKGKHFKKADVRPLTKS